MEGVVPHRTCTALCWWVVGDVLQLLVDPLKSHLLRWVGFDWGWEGGSGPLTSSESALQEKKLQLAKPDKQEQGARQARKQVEGRVWLLSFPACWAEAPVSVAHI